MSRLEKMKRLIIEEANKRLLGEQQLSIPQPEDIKLDDEDSERLHDLLNTHPESHTFIDSLSHNVHAHLGTDNHLTLEFPHLGPHHNIGLSLEGTYLSSHGGHGEITTDTPLTPHIVFGGGLKIPIKSFGGKHH